MRVASTTALALTLGALTVSAAAGHDVRRSRRSCHAKGNTGNNNDAVAAPTTGTANVPVPVPTATEQVPVDAVQSTGVTAAAPTVEAAQTTAAADDAAAAAAETTGVTAADVSAATDATATAPTATAEAPENTESTTAAAAETTATAAAAAEETTAPSSTSTASASSATPTFPVPPSARTFSQSSTAEDIAGTSDLSQFIVSYYNQWRAEFGSGEVTWDATMAQSATDQMNACKWTHEDSGNDNNLAAGSVWSWSVNDMLDMWAGEYTAWNFADPNASELSHFSMMTWKATTTIGCGWSYGTCTENGSSMFYLSCKHNPAGNYVGEAAANIGSFVGA